MSGHESNIPKLKIPDFKPELPEHLLKHVSDPGVRYLMEEQNRQGQLLRFMSNTMTDSNSQLRHINGSVQDLKGWRETEANPKIKTLKEQVKDIREEVEEDQLAQKLNRILDERHDKNRRTWFYNSTIARNVAAIMVTICSAIVSIVTVILALDKFGILE